jgi:hypothetical protein
MILKAPTKNSLSLRASIWGQPPQRKFPLKALKLLYSIMNLNTISKANNKQSQNKPKKKEKEEKTSLPRSLEMSWWWWWWGHVLWLGLACFGFFGIYMNLVSFASALLKTNLVVASSLQCCCN